MHLLLSAVDDQIYRRLAVRCDESKPRLFPASVYRVKLMQIKHNNEYNNIQLSDDVFETVSRGLSMLQKICEAPLTHFPKMTVSEFQNSYMNFSTNQTMMNACEIYPFHQKAYMNRGVSKLIHNVYPTSAHQKNVSTLYHFLHSDLQNHIISPRMFIAWKFALERAWEGLEVSSADHTRLLSTLGPIMKGLGDRANCPSLYQTDLQWDDYDNLAKTWDSVYDNDGMLLLDLSNVVCRV